MAENFKEWCIKCHEDTNHYYDSYINYEFHLRLVEKVAKQFKHLWFRPGKGIGVGFAYVQDACYSHDVIEDTRKTWSDVYTAAEKFMHPDFAKFITDITYAVTNEKGKNRAERANTKYYEGIRNTPGAIFVKLCDRIANVEYGLLTKSSMVKKYKEENENFKKELYVEEYKEMWDYLENLFNS
jgi:hypothetical protein